MATTAMQRPATVSFGGDIVLDRRRGSRSYSIQHDRRDSYDQLRRQSIKYQFPNPILEAEIKDSDLVCLNLGVIYLVYMFLVLIKYSS